MEAMGLFAQENGQRSWTTVFSGHFLILVISLQAASERDTENWIWNFVTEKQMLWSSTITISDSFIRMRFFVFCCRGCCFWSWSYILFPGKWSRFHRSRRVSCRWLPEIWQRLRRNTAEMRSEFCRRNWTNSGSHWTIRSGRSRRAGRRIRIWSPRCPTTCGRRLRSWTGIWKS